MALTLSRGHLGSAISQAHRVHSRARAALEKMHHTTRTVVRTAEVSGAAFAFGLLQGRLPATKQKVLGVPVDLGSAVLLHVFGFAGLGGDYSGHLHNLGDGVLASYTNKQGILLGSEMAKKAALKAGVSGALEDGLEGESLSDEDMANINR